MTYLWQQAELVTYKTAILLKRAIEQRHFRRQEYSHIHKVV